MNYFRALLYCFGAVGTAAFGVSACSEPKTCTLIGCTDQFSLVFRHPSGEAPVNSVALDVDGLRFSCVPVIGDTTARCGDNVFASIEPIMDCHEEQGQSGTKTQICNATGRYEEHIVFQGTPKMIHATVLHGDELVAERTFEPTYETKRPNGPGCDPACRQTTASWDLPASPQ